MNMDSSVCASSSPANAWEQIDWSQCERQVSRLQARIVKAIQEKRWGKVKALQRLLTCSFSGKALAVKRVTDNQGRRTPGVDGKIWSTPASKHKALGSLQRRGYQPQPLRRVHIPKANGKLRPLGIPTMTDRAMQALHLQALLPVAETTADKNSYGFRPGRSTADAIGQCFLMLRGGSHSMAEWVLEGDIQGCFDNIAHEWMLRHVPTDKVVLQKMAEGGLHGKSNPLPHGGRHATGRDYLAHAGQPDFGRTGNTPETTLPREARQRSAGQSKDTPHSVCG
jgi:RNA-directed DNA polymerase